MSDGGAGCELFCLSFLALFLELMVIRWAPAVVRLIAYYANLMLISSFLGLGMGAIVGKTRKSLFGWLPALLLINVAMAVDCPFHHAADDCLGEQVLHTDSSTRALCKPGGYFRQQRDRVRTAGPADRIAL